jgi:CubicO group peptidase (beta-lactamase class C family)
LLCAALLTSAGPARAQSTRAGIPAAPPPAAGAPASVSTGLPRAATPESVGFSGARLRRLDRFMEGEVAARRKAGVVVLIARHGRIAWEKAYGVADLASGKPLRTDAMFRLFSMTKPITSVALLTLFEQGKFQLTDPLEHSIAAFKDVRVYSGTDAEGHMTLEPPGRAITLHDVFRHTAGFAYGGYFEDTPVDKAYQAQGVVYEKLDSPAELVRKLAGLPLLYDPGSRWVYSFAPDVQAYLVEFFSGRSFADYCRRTIFEPLGMRDTVFGIPPERAARFPTGYHADASGALVAFGPDEDPYKHFTTHPFGGVSLSSTAEDYLRFAQMLLSGGELNGQRILGRKTVELMSSPSLPAGTAYWTAGKSYGLGVEVLTDPAQHGNLGSPGSFGWPGLASTWFTIDPREDLIALVLTQFAPRDVRFDEEFQTLVYQALVSASGPSASRNGPSQGSKFRH